MPNLLIVLGAVLVLAGMAGIAAGAPSWALGLGLGSTLIESGTVSFVGGLVLFALALVLRSLEELTHRIAASAPMESRRALPPPPLGASPTPSRSSPAIQGRRAAPPDEYDPPQHDPAWAADGYDELPDRYPSRRRPRPRPNEPTIVTDRNPSGSTVVRSGIVGGMAYTLYADGSIEAELPIGTVRFASLAELQDHVTRTGEEADAEFSGPTQ